MKKITVIQSSLRKDSNTAIVARKFAEKCDALGLHVHYVDLRDVKMDLCDARPLEGYSQDIQNVYNIMDESDAIVYGMPVYNYSMSGVLKNFIDITGKSVAGKPVGIIAVAGWTNCYMAGRDLFDSMYYEYGCMNIYPTPYTSSADFQNGEIVNEKVLGKLDELAQKLIII